MEKIGIYPGSFDPPHPGHIRAAQAAMAQLGLARVLLIPDRSGPKKSLIASYEQRLEMVSLSQKPGLIAALSPRTQGPSYTFLTLQRLRRGSPGAHFVLLIGADQARTLPTWRQAAEFLPGLTVAILTRPGSRPDPAPILALGARVEWVENPPDPLSSTQARRLIAFDCRGCLEPRVAAYIREHGLYDSRKDWRRLSLPDLESRVLPLLDPGRVAHVRGCRDAAVALAHRWGADAVAAARAALLHDITKALDGPLQLTLAAEYGMLLDDFSRAYPKTLHAATGAQVARHIFGEGEAVVSAIRWHTTGRAHMTTLEKLLYVADYMEPNRDFPGVERLRALAEADLDGAVKLGLELTLEHLARQGAQVSPASVQALQWLRETT